jgi:hypothetical protein
MSNNNKEVLAIWASAIDAAFPDCKLHEKLQRAAESLEYTIGFLGKSSEAKEEKSIELEGKPITQEQFNNIYEGYKHIEVAKIYIKKYRETLLKVIYNQPDMAMQLIEVILNIKKD